MEDPATVQRDQWLHRGIRVRRAGVSDLAALIALENAIFTSDRLSARQWRRHLISSSACILVAADSVAVHAASVLLFRRNSRIARLYSLSVSVDARGQGLGDALLAASEVESRHHGCALLRLEVRRDNTNAERLYQRHGYRLFATCPDYYEDGETALRYEKELTLP